LKTPRLIFAAAALALTLGVLLVGAASDSRIDVAVDCHCPDPIGAGSCVAFKQKVSASPGYRLVPNSASGYGIGVHFSSVDLWQVINAETAGRITAVSVAFTIYAEKLPVFTCGRSRAWPIWNAVGPPWVLIQNSPSISPPPRAS
jgi:hypothetical protein